MDAYRFLRAFGHAFSQVKPTGKREQWTAGISDVLDRVGAAQNLLVCRKKGGSCHRELWRIVDYAFCKNTAETPTIHSSNIDTNWYPPVAVVEHENEPKFDAAWYDFCKLCLFAIPLRVMIGYGKNDLDAKILGDRLVESYEKYEHQQLPGGETLIMMGWYHAVGYPSEGHPFHYHLWLLQDGQVTRHLYSVATDEIDARLSEWD